MRFLTRHRLMPMDRWLQRRWPAIRDRWLMRIRVFMGVIAIAIIGLQFTALMYQPQSRFAVLVLLVAGCLLWRNRQRMKAVLYREHSFTSRWVRFPGFLILAAVPIGLLGTMFSLLAMVAGGAVCYLGWMLGRRASGSAWESVAPGWMLLFLLCVPNRLPVDPLGLITRWITSLASHRLDQNAIFHVLRPTDLILIDSHRVVSLDTNVLLSSYALIALLAIWMAVRHWPAIMAGVGLCLAVLCGAALVPLRIYMAGQMSTAAVADAWMSADTMAQVLAFFAAGLLLLSAVSIAGFAFGPIVQPRNEREISVRYLLRGTRPSGALHKRYRTLFSRSILSENRLSGQWNRFATASVGSLMYGDELASALGGKLTAKFDHASIGRFIANYLATRRWGLFVAGVPIGLLMLVTISDCVRKSPNTLNNDLALVYQSQLDKRIKQIDFDASKGLVEKLSRLAPNRAQPTFDLATAMVQSDHQAAGIQAMQQLLARDPQHSQAHLWIATQYLKNDPTASANVKEAKSHLVAAINSDRTNWEAIKAYALLLASRGQVADAAAELRKSTFANPAVELEVARLQHQLGLTSDAADRGRRLANQLAALGINRQAPLEPLQTAAAYVIAGDLCQTLTTLESAMAAGDQNANIKESLVRTLLVLCRLDDLENRELRADRLRRAIEIDPLYPELCTYCAQLMFSSDAAEDEKLRDLCRVVVSEAMALPNAPAELFLIVGTGAAQQGKFDLAEQHLRLAYDKGERSPAALNNLAWVIGQSATGDREFALRLATESIENDARSQDAYATRAEILVSLERYQEAIVDLERVVQLQGRSPKVAGQLADLYDRVGDPQTAASYRTVHSLDSAN